MKTTYVEGKDDSKETLKSKKVKPAGSSTPFRIFAIVFWIIGICMEVCAFFTFTGKINITQFNPLYVTIFFLVIDAIFVIIGSLLWKKANHISPASKSNAFAFWLQNNFGTIISVIAFLPVIILFLLDKNSDKKTKSIAAVVAAVLLAISGISSYDFNPISSEEVAKAEAVLGTQTVYWTQYGKVYHLDNDCSHLNKTIEGYEGLVGTAIENGKTRLCKTCAKKHNITDLTLED